jgi:hypothetical protein
MRSFILTFALTLAAMFAAPAGAADDWSFITGNYAVDPADCATITKGKPFSKQWVGALGQDVLTQAGITSPREVHCKFRSSEKGEQGWTVHADCEELGEGAPYDLAVVANEDGSLAVSNEDVWGPEALVFQICK